MSFKCDVFGLLMTTGLVELEVIPLYHDKKSCLEINVEAFVPILL